MDISCSTQQRYFQFGTALSTGVQAASKARHKDFVFATYQGIVTGTGAVSATIQIQATNEDATADGTKASWITLGTITLSGTTTATDGLSTMSAWRWVRANVTAIAGTGATVEVIQGN